MTAELTFTPIRDSYSAIPTYPTLGTMLDGAATRKRIDYLYAPHEVTVSWKLNAIDYTNFMGFFRTTLLNSTEYFLMDLVVDIGALVPHRCRVKSGGTPRLNQVNGITFHVTATLEVEVNPTWTGLIAYGNPSNVNFNHTSPKLVGPIQPGDTVQIFNSEGTHPSGEIEWIFDGVSGNITLGNNPTFSPTATTPFTASVWFKTSSTAAMHLFGKQDGVPLVATGWSMFIQAGGTMFLALRSSFTNKAEVQTAALFHDGIEHHAVFRHSGSGTVAGLSLRVDGADVSLVTIEDSLAGNSTSTTAPATIGMRNGTLLPFDGTIKHVSYWSIALNDSQADDLYNDGVPPDLSLLPFFSNCEGWWKVDALDEVGTDGMIDYSGNGNEGTAEGGLVPTVGDGSVDVNLDGIYEVFSVTPNNQIKLVDPELVNSDWLLLAGIGSYGSDTVISTLTRHPRT
jgi:hypothetical protein